MKKVHKIAWKKSTKTHRFKNRRQTNPLLKTVSRLLVEKIPNAPPSSVVSQQHKNIFPCSYRPMSATVHRAMLGRARLCHSKSSLCLWRSGM